MEVTSGKGVIVVGILLVVKGSVTGSVTGSVKGSVTGTLIGSVTVVGEVVVVGLAVVEVAVGIREGVDSVVRIVVGVSKGRHE